jgi:para-aminobenzoate synthetase component 1
MTPLVEELIPCPDPWDVARKLAHLPNLLFLDSADPTTERGRYSYVAADPITDLVLSPKNILRRNPFDDDIFDCWRIEPPEHVQIPPFLGGWVGLFGYGLGRAFERQAVAAHDDFDVPDLALGVYDWVISFDHRRHRSWIISTGVIPGFPFTNDRLARAESRIDEIKERLSHGGQSPQPVSTTPTARPQDYHTLPGYPWVGSSFSRDQYLAAVRKAIAYVHAGDCFQVNLSQRLLAPLREHPLELYGRLRQRNPAPYGCYFDLGDFQILSASPEQFLKVSNGDVVTRPIKGTRPRGATPEEDARIVRELQSNPKDRAENVMIVDLLRNDLGRVCEYGSIHVPKVCEVETFAHVHHLVSEVRGKLRPDKTPFDLLRAAFPGGSVTGAPKVRAMEIIAELEPTARGPYCGSVGFVGFDGSMDSNILIRTFTAGRGWVQFPVGGGIVADSDPETEYEETLHKAKGLLDALEQ